MPLNKVDETTLKGLRKLLAKARSVDELMEQLLVSRRTVYRYLDRLQEEGHMVCATPQRPTRYFIQK